MLATNTNLLFCASPSLWPEVWMRPNQMIVFCELRTWVHGWTPEPYDEGRSARDVEPEDGKERRLDLSEG